MTEETPSLAHGDEYVALYVGGPNDGQTDHRISIAGGWHEELAVLTAVDGKETLENYTAQSWRKVGDRVHVTYLWDEADSEPVADPEDRGDRQ